MPPSVIEERTSNIIAAPFSSRSLASVALITVAVQMCVFLWPSRKDFSLGFTTLSINIRRLCHHIRDIILIVRIVRSDGWDGAPRPSNVPRAHGPAEQRWRVHHGNGRRHQLPACVPWQGWYVHNFEDKQAGTQAICEGGFLRIISEYQLLYLAAAPDELGRKSFWLRSRTVLNHE